MLHMDALIHLALFLLSACILLRESFSSHAASFPLSWHADSYLAHLAQKVECNSGVEQVLSTNAIVLRAKTPSSGDTRHTQHTQANSALQADSDTATVELALDAQAGPMFYKIVKPTNTMLPYLLGKFTKGLGHGNASAAGIGFPIASAFLDDYVRYIFSFPYYGESTPDMPAPHLLSAFEVMIRIQTQ